MKPVAELISYHAEKIRWLNDTKYQSAGFKLYAIPEGHCVVPVEPTNAICDAPRQFILFCQSAMNRNYTDARQYMDDCGVSIDSWPEWAKIAEGHITKSAIAAIIYSMMIQASQREGEK